MSAEVYQAFRAHHRTEEDIHAALLKKAREAPIPCPTCREAVASPILSSLACVASEKASQTETTDDVGVLANALSLFRFNISLNFSLQKKIKISDKQRQLQCERRRLFDRQLAKGGIIDAFAKTTGQDVLRIRSEGVDDVSYWIFFKKKIMGGVWTVSHLRYCVLRLVLRCHHHQFLYQLNRYWLFLGTKRNTKKRARDKHRLNLSHSHHHNNPKLQQNSHHLVSRNQQQELD